MTLKSRWKQPDWESTECPHGCSANKTKGRVCLLDPCSCGWRQKSRSTWPLCYVSGIEAPMIHASATVLCSLAKREAEDTLRATKWGVNVAVLGIINRAVWGLAVPNQHEYKRLSSPLHLHSMHVFWHYAMAYIINMPIWQGTVVKLDSSFCLSDACVMTVLN